MPRIDGINHISLTVTDVARSAAWYERVLGFRVLNSVRVSGYSTKVIALPTGGVVLSLNQHPSDPVDRFSESRTGLDHLSFAVSDPAELKQWMAHLDALGVPHSPVAEDLFGVVLVFRDPDNIQLEFFVPIRPGATTFGAVAPVAHRPQGGDDSDDS